MLSWDWSSARLVPVIAWTRGYPLYPPAGEGPITDMIYGPLGAMVYLPAAACSSPTGAIVTGGIIAHLLLVVPILFIHLRVVPADGRSMLLALLCASGTYLSLALTRGTRYWLENIHADAPALGFAILACGFLISKEKGSPPSNRSLLGSAVCATLAMFSKQVEMPLLPAFTAWIWSVFGRRAALRYAPAVAGTTIVLLLLSILLFGSGPLFFNLFVVPSRHPWETSFTAAVAQFLILLPIPTAILFIGGILVWLAVPSGLSHPRRPFTEPATILLMAAAALVPTALLSRVKTGGRDNSFHPLLFLFVAASVFLLRGATVPGNSRVRRIGAVLVCVCVLAIGGMALTALSTFRAIPSAEAFRNNPLEMALSFSREHPRQVYYPWNPLITLLSEGELYHFDYGVFDRELAGFPVTEENYRKHIPSDLHWMGAGEEALKHLGQSYRFVPVQGLPKIVFSVEAQR